MSDNISVRRDNKIEDIPVTLVKRINGRKGREILLSQLDNDIDYYLKIEKTPTFNIRYNIPLTKEEIEREVMLHRSYSNHQGFYVVPVRRRI